MTATPASVAPGLAPTAVSWGYPHLEVFALTKNRTASVYRKWRDSNATSERDFQPLGVDMALVGGSVDTDKAPSAAVNRRVITGGKAENRTDLHVLADKRIRRKYHSQDQNWGPGDGPGSWNRFRSPVDIIGAPTLVSYALDSTRMKSFFLGVGGARSCIYYYEWTLSKSDWGGYNALDGPDLYPVRPAPPGPLWDRPPSCADPCECVLVGNPGGTGVGGRRQPARRFLHIAHRQPPDPLVQNRRN